MRYELSDYEWTAIKPMLEQAACRRACIRLTNEDVSDHYSRVNVGTR